MEFKDYYRVLGVERDASPEAIKKAYRRLARKHHPDVSKAADAAARMSEVNEAYAVLSDPEKRAGYDALGSGRRQGEAFNAPPPGWEGNFGHWHGGEDLFEDDGFSEFFNRLFSRAGMARQPGRGEDHRATITLDLEDAWRGGTRSITLRGAQAGDDGRLKVAERQYEVTIPRGVRPGQRIRLAGQGGAGRPRGDLYLEVQIEPSARFRLEGRNLVAELPVAPWEAALGAVVPVELPDGSKLKVRVPAGAQSGRRLSVRGRGWPAAQGEPGDLELVVSVVLPSAHDPRARKLYERMASELADFDARRQIAAGGGDD